MTLDEVLKAHVLKTLSESSSKLEAAKSLGISIRTLRNYLNQWGERNACPGTQKFTYDKFACMKNLNPKERDDGENWEGE